MRLILCAAATLLLSACAITHESFVLVGTARPAISPDQVKLYVKAPAKYEVIALVSADAAHDFMAKQELMDKAIANLKVEAAKLGANGVLLDTAGDFDVGSSGIAFAPGAVRAGAVMSVGAANNRTGKQASGKALFVTEE